MRKSKTINIIVICAILFILNSCTIKEQKAKFLPLPATEHGVKAWDIIINVAIEHYKGVEYTDKKEGIIKSLPKITDTCWAGLLYGGFVPCESERFIARVWTLSPFKADIAVQRHKATSVSSYQEWIEDGNNLGKEKELYEELVSKLSSI